MDFKPLTNADLPENILLKEDGSLVLSDGSSLADYLIQFRESSGMVGDVSVSIMTTSDTQRALEDSYMWRNGQGA